MNLNCELSESCDFYSGSVVADLTYTEHIFHHPLYDCLSISVRARMFQAVLICIASISSVTCSAFDDNNEYLFDEEKNFGLTYSATSLPSLWLNTSTVSTWVALAGNVALVVGGLMLSQKINVGKDIYDGDDDQTLVLVPNTFSSGESAVKNIDIVDIDKIVRILVKLKYGVRNKVDAQKQNIEEFVNRYY